MFDAFHKQSAGKATAVEAPTDSSPHIPVHTREERISRYKSKIEKKKVPKKDHEDKSFLKKIGWI